MSCAHVCPICALEKPTCATKSKRSTTSSPTARPISSSPPTSKASSPSSTPRLNCPPLTNANACCGCSSKTFSSDPTRSPSGTVSRSGNAPPTTPNPPPTPTRRTTMPDIAHCVWGRGETARVHRVDANVLLRQRCGVVTHQSDGAMFGSRVAGRAVTHRGKCGTDGLESRCRTRDHDRSAIAVLQLRRQSGLDREVHTLEHHVDGIQEGGHAAQ